MSDRFLAALRETHSISVAAYVYRPSAPAVPIEVPIVGGSLTIDRDAQVRRQASLDVAFSLAEQLTRDIVRELPFGGYCVIERGIQYADGTTERVKLGHFRVESVVWAELQGTATLTLADRMAQIQDARFLVPYAPVLKPTEAIRECIYTVFGDTIIYGYETDVASETNLVDTVFEEDRAEAVANLASSVGAVAFFNANGDFRLNMRDRTEPPVWKLDAGDRGSLISAVETLDRSTVRNGVVVRGQAGAETPPFTSLVTHDDPYSPTRWGGPFGNVALISTSAAVGSQAQADATARSLLNLRLGVQRTVTLLGLPNPALEPDDAIEIVFPDGRQETHRINALRFDLGVEGQLEVTTNSQFSRYQSPSAA